jgi:hypothetical protein
LEVLEKIKPDYQSVRIFGCACYPNLHPFNARKLEYRSVQCAFLGYSNLHKGFKCLDINSGRLYISRDVIFDETIFPFAKLHSNAGMRLSQEILLLSSHLLNPDQFDHGVENSADPTMTNASINPANGACEFTENREGNEEENGEEIGADLVQITESDRDRMCTTRHGTEAQGQVDPAATSSAENASPTASPRLGHQRIQSLRATLAQVSRQNRVTAAGGPRPREPTALARCSAARGGPSSHHTEDSGSDAPTSDHEVDTRRNPEEDPAASTGSGSGVASGPTSSAPASDGEIPVQRMSTRLLTRVNSTNVLDEGLRIGEIGRRMNSKVKLVEIGAYRK